MSDTGPKDNIVEDMRSLIEGIAKSLVDDPAEVQVTIRDDQTSTILILVVGADDLGKLIGKQGRTARSIRTILSAAGLKAQHRFSLDITLALPDDVNGLARSA